MTARLRALAPYLAVAFVAIALREALVARGGGLHGSFGYDTSVYYAAADAFIHGRMPYSDFVLLHPPAIMLVLTPSALLGHLTNDHIGFYSATVGFTAIGGLNAALVTWVARRWGLGRVPALAGGLFYATWIGAVAAEFSCRLEPLGNAFLLVGLGLVGPHRKAGSGAGGRAFVLAGVALGLAASTKIWFVVPALVLAGWLLSGRRRSEAGRFGLGLGAALLVVDGPFLVQSRGAMFSRVVLDQLDRHPNRVSPRVRWSWLSTVGHLPHGARSTMLLLVAAVLFVALIALAFRAAGPRLFPLLAVAHMAVLFVAPSWFSFYADFAAVPVALSVANAAASTAPRRLGRWVAGAALTAAVGSSLAVLVAGSMIVSQPWHRLPALLARVHGVRCVMSDAPYGLIELNALDRDLSHGCPNWIDVTGRTYYGRDRKTGPRRNDARWQRDLVAYLRAGRAAFVVRGTGDGLTPASRAALARGRAVLYLPKQALYTAGPRRTRG